MILILMMVFVMVPLTSFLLCFAIAFANALKDHCLITMMPWASRAQSEKSSNQKKQNDGTTKRYLKKSFSQFFHFETFFIIESSISYLSFHTFHLTIFSYIFLKYFSYFQIAIQLCLNQTFFTLITNFLSHLKLESQKSRSIHNIKYSTTIVDVHEYHDKPNCSDKL